MSSLAKHTIIKYLEDIIIIMGSYPNDANVVQKLIKNKNVDI